MTSLTSLGLIASFSFLMLAVPSAAAAAGHGPAVGAEPARTTTPVPRPAAHAEPSPKAEASSKAEAPPKVETPSKATPPSSIRIATSAGLNRPLEDGVASAKLSAVHKQVETLAATGKKPWVIMDIDDTLVHTVTFPHNTAVDGAVAYAKSLTQAGGTIVYVTGRKDTPGEHAKTLASLQRLGFPLGNQGQVELNGTKLSTVLYKKEETNELVKKLGKPVAAFDNEIANARMFRSDLPGSVKVFRLATTSFSKDTGGRGQILVIKNFAPRADGANAGVAKTAGSSP